ncbi:MAG: response regulator [Bacillota bacterium]|nr:response regulator [Bacillota bacterium]
MNTLLVIDDNLLDNAVIRDYLFTERYNIISASNGLEALEFIEGRSIDLIILDIAMPVMDGFEFLKQFSLSGFYGKIPVIILTSLNDDEGYEKVFTYDIYDYISKPLSNMNKLVFINKIKNALKSREYVKSST